MGMYYIKYQEAGHKLPDHLCLTSTNSGEKHLGEVLATPNKTDDMPCEIRTVAHLAQHFFPNRIKRSCYSEEMKRKRKKKFKNIKKTIKLSYCCTSSACTLVDFKTCILQRVCGK